MRNDVEDILLQRRGNYTGFTPSDGRVLVSIFSRLKLKALVHVHLHTPPIHAHAHPHARARTHTHTHTESVFLL
jgi:hypothetical protein